MKPYERVALKYANAPQYTFKTEKVGARNLKVSLKDRWIDAGQVFANIEHFSLGEIRGFKCSEEMESLISSFPQLKSPNSDLICVVEVAHSQLMADYRNKGLGVRLYRELISYALSENNNQPYLFIPNYCHRRSTTPEALRVWKSLAREYESEGDVLAIF